MSERREVIVGGTTFYADVIDGQTVLVQVVPEARPDPFARTSTARRTGSDGQYIRGKGWRRRYYQHRAPSYRPGYRLTTKD